MVPNRKTASPTISRRVIAIPETLLKQQSGIKDVSSLVAGLRKSGLRTTTSLHAKETWVILESSSDTILLHTISDLLGLKVFTTLQSTTARKGKTRPRSSSPKRD